jgi:DNA-directed RNA polymerase sigma subunit (sigma70/sigma32)
MPRQKSETPIERLTVMSQAEVGRCLGITAMRVCQIERKAFQKIREELIARRITNAKGQRVSA